jgi:hypothetical protein
MITDGFSDLVIRIGVQSRIASRIALECPYNALMLDPHNIQGTRSIHVYVHPNPYMHIEPSSWRVIPDYRPFDRASPDLD